MYEMIERSECFLLDNKKLKWFENSYAKKTFGFFFPENSFAELQKVSALSRCCFFLSRSDQVLNLLPNISITT